MKKGIKGRTIAKVAIAGIFLGAVTASIAQPVMNATAVASDVTLRLFAADTPVQGESNLWRTFFELPRGFELASDAVMRLDYDYSATLIPQRGSLTILLNGQPIESRRLPGVKPGESTWQLRLPRRYFKAGFNELQIASRKRSLTGDCVDEDNLSNWLRYRGTSTLSFTRVAGAFSLRSYPFPFLNTLEQEPRAVPIVVPSSAPASALSSALSIAADWGSRTQDRPLPIKITKSAPAGFSVMTGLASDFPQQRANPIELWGSALWVTGKDEKELAAAVQTLADRNLSEQLAGSTAAPIAATSEDRDRSPLIGNVTFAELGFPRTELRGAGTQTASINVRRPLVTNLGRGGTIRLRFVHSAALQPQRSVLSVSINSEAIGSVALTPDNANNGELVLEIPVSQASQNQWNIVITAHNDIGSQDCSRLFEDVAWTTVLGSSEFQLAEGSLIGTPFLEGFPYLRDRKGALPARLTMNVGAEPSNGLLSLAGTLAARASQSNRAAAEWIATSEAVKGDEAIVFASYNDESRLSALASGLLFSPSASGTPVPKQGLKVLPTILPGALIVQAVANKANGVTYVVIGDEDAFARFSRFLAKPSSRDLIRGQAAVLTEDGRFFTFDTTKPSERRMAEQGEMRRYKPEMMAIMSVVILLAIALIVFIGSKFVKRKPKAS